MSLYWRYAVGFMPLSEFTVVVQYLRYEKLRALNINWCICPTQ